MGRQMDLGRWAPEQGSLDEFGADDADADSSPGRDPVPMSQTVEWDSGVQRSPPDRQESGRRQIDCRRVDAADGEGTVEMEPGDRIRVYCDPASGDGTDAYCGTIEKMERITWKKADGAASVLHLSTGSTVWVRPSNAVVEDGRIVGYWNRIQLPGDGD